MKKKMKSFIVLGLCACIGLTSVGCGTSRAEVEHAYQLYDTTDQYVENETVLSTSKGTDFFAEDLCVGGMKNSSSDLVNAAKAETACIYTLNNGEITYAKNVYEKRYPASTTKILTALLAFKYGDLDQEITVSHEAVQGLDPASSLAGFKEGDKITLRQALYGLMLASGNEAANVIAEAVSGSIPEFVNLMNEEAHSLGATGSHFMNPSGLPDDNHYTTAYDLYLIFNEALSYDEFVEIISSKTYQADYSRSDGTPVSATWENTNGYFSGLSDAPDGIEIIGGKTGTTNAAGNCLVLYSKNAAGEPLISIVMKAETKDTIYKIMNQMLVNFSN